jgi:hypothetical protein
MNFPPSWEENILKFLWSYSCLLFYEEEEFKEPKSMFKDFILKNVDGFIKSIISTAAALVSRMP